MHGQSWYNANPFYTDIFSWFLYFSLFSRKNSRILETIGLGKTLIRNGLTNFSPCCVSYRNQSFVFLTGFYMKYNTGLKWVKRENNEIASTLLGVIYLVRKQNLSKSVHFLPRVRTRTYHGVRNVSFLKNFAYVLNQ